MPHEILTQTLTQFRQIHDSTVPGPARRACAHPGNHDRRQRVLTSQVAAGNILPELLKGLYMHFRERGHVVQIIRTVYDADSKKGKNEIVGRLAKSDPKISAELQAVLTAEERQEAAAWIEGHASIERLKRELAARSLPGQLALAKEWFKDHKADDARILAATLMPAWFELRAELKRNGLVE